jgi:hypothetical protein
MNDDAIAPVVAVMMILVVAVTLLSIWNAIYLPDLKQQAEVEHLKEVEEGFREIDSDISHMVSLNRSGIVKVSIPLGGGDILLHQARSGGSLTVQDPYDLIEISHSTSGFIRTSYMSKIQYSPVSNYWVNQGYTWETYLNVSKGSMTTPLEFGQTGDVEVGHYIRINTDSNPISIAVLNITQGEPRSVSGNGIATINMDGESGQGLLLKGSVDPVYIKVNTTPLSGKKINESVYSKLNGYYIADGEYLINKDVSITIYNLTLSVR